MDQDPLGVQGTVCYQSGSDKAIQVWRRPLHDGSIAIVALNRNAAPTNVSIDLAQCAHGGSVSVTDVWTGKSLGTASGALTTPQITKHAHAFLRLAKPAEQRGELRCLRSHSAVERMALACPPGARIESMSAWWGSAPGASCGEEEGLLDRAGAADRTAWLSDGCLGRQSCAFEASAAALGQVAVAEPRLAVSFRCGQAL